MRIAAKLPARTGKAWSITYGLSHHIYRCAERVRMIWISADVALRTHAPRTGEILGEAIAVIMCSFRTAEYETFPRSQAPTANNIRVSVYEESLDIYKLQTYIYKAVRSQQDGWDGTSERFALILFLILIVSLIRRTRMSTGRKNGLMWRTQTHSSRSSGLPGYQIYCCCCIYPICCTTCVDIQHPFRAVSDEQKKTRFVIFL